MPELPDVTIYVEALNQRIVGERLDAVRIHAPFLLRTVDPPLESVAGRVVREVRRLGKRIAIGLDEEFWLVIHLMIAGRLHWHQSPPKLSERVIASFDFTEGAGRLANERGSVGGSRVAGGSLSLTEAGSKKRASLHVVVGEKELLALDPGGIDVMTADPPAFAAALSARNHTLKRALTDPHIFSGIGNAYSDEILHRAQLSPIALTQKLTPKQIQTLFSGVRSTLEEWTARFIEEAQIQFPENVTAFREGMAVHGRYGEPCPRCGTKVQRIRYADNETNYCAQCQTGGRLLADRALSRLLKQDFPRTLEELEELRAQAVPRAPEPPRKPGLSRKRRRPG